MSAETAPAPAATDSGTTPAPAAPNPETNILADAPPAGATTPAPATKAAEQKQDIENLSAQTAPSGVEWLKDIDEEFRGKGSINKYTSMNELLKSHVELTGMMRTKQNMKQPTAESTPEEIAAWQEHVGVPETYELSPALAAQDEEWMKGVFGETGLAEVNASLKAVNMNQAQLDASHEAFNNVIDMMNKNYAESQIVAAKQEVIDTRGTLEAVWGKNLDSNLQQVKDYIQAEGLSELLTEKGINNNAKILQMFKTAIDGQGEHSIAGTQTGHHKSKADRLKDYRENKGSRTAKENESIWNKIFEDEHK